MQGISEENWDAEFMNELGSQNNEQLDVDNESQGDDTDEKEEDGDEAKCEAKVKSYTEAINSLEAAFRYFECQGHTDEATTTFRLMDKISVLHFEAVQNSCQLCPCKWAERAIYVTN